MQADRPPSAGLLAQKKELSGAPDEERTTRQMAAPAVYYPKSPMQTLEVCKGNRQSIAA